MDFQPGDFVTRRARSKIYFVMQVLSCELVVYDLHMSCIRYITREKAILINLPKVKTQLSRGIAN